MSVDQKTKKNILTGTILVGVSALVFTIIKDRKNNKQGETEAKNNVPLAPQNTINLPTNTVATPKSNPSGSSVKKPSSLRYAVTLKDTTMYKTIKPGYFNLYNSLADELGKMPKGYYIGSVLEVEQSDSGYVKLNRLIGGKNYVFYVLKNDFYFGGANVKFILPTDKYTLPTKQSTKDFLSNWIQY